MGIAAASLLESGAVALATMVQLFMIRDTRMSFFWDHRLEAQASHAPPVGLEHFDLDSAVLDFFSWNGDSSKEFNDGAGNRSAIGLGNQGNSQFFFECIKVAAAGHGKHSRALLG